MTSLKAQKEAFVTGHEGTTPLEVFLICLSTPVGFALYRQVILRLDCTSMVFRVVLEGIVFVLPVILCQSVWLYPWGLIFLLLETAVALGLAAVVFPPRQQLAASALKNKNKIDNPTSSSTTTTTTTTATQEQRRLGFITAYRSSLLYLTFCAILAVDFPFFPRRFAKTEVWGYGLMDLGAASSIIAGGIMTSSLSTTRTTTTTTTTTATRKRPLKIRQWLVFISLGLLRLFTHKNVDYQEHVTEYGVHWNFYFTLAFISILSSVITTNSTTATTTTTTFSWSKISWIAPLLLLFLYQLALQLFGLQNYMEHGPRHCPLPFNTNVTRSLVLFCDLMAANREGIFGCVGYFFLWWASQQIAKDSIWVPTTTVNPTITVENMAHVETSTNTTALFRRGHPWRLGLISASLWVLHAILVYAMNMPVSRRTTNASFCIWTLAHNFSLLTMFWLVLGKDEEESTNVLVVGSGGGGGDGGGGGRPLLPPMCVAVNRHGMPTFVVANLLTGIVNLSISTLETSHVAALAILLSYLLVVGCLALALDAMPALFRRSSLSSTLKQD